MARSAKYTVEYFPFLCKEGKTMFYIEKKYGNDGYATWVKLLRQLAVTDNHWLNLCNQIDLMFLASKCNISEEKLKEIIDDLCKLGEFNKMLWEENQIIFSEKFVREITDAYEKRKNDCITLGALLHLLSDLGVRKLSLRESEGTGSTQTISENIIVENTISENIRSERNQPEILEIVFPFPGEEFKTHWQKWLQYRSEKKINYKSKKTEQLALDGLKKYSAPFVQMLITRSITNNWQGLVFDKTDLEFQNFKNGNNNGIGQKISSGAGAGQL